MRYTTWFRLNCQDHIIFVNLFRHFPCVFTQKISSVGLPNHLTLIAVCQAAEMDEEKTVLPARSPVE